MNKIKKYISSKNQREMLYTAVAFASGIVAKSTINYLWKLSTKSAPPDKLTDTNKSLKKAIPWRLSVASISAIASFLVARTITEKIEHQ